jgi:hypothetical protein
MSGRSLRLGVFNRNGRRPPGTGGHVGLFHLARLDDDGGRVISIGYLRFDRRDLEPLRAKGLQVRVTAVGVMRLGDDVSPALAEAVLDARVIGRVIADPRTRAAVRGDRSAPPVDRP